MPFEDIEVKIARDGTVYVRVDGISEERIRSLREFLEEQIGPISSMEIVRKPDWDSPVQRAAEDATKQAEPLKINRNS